MATSSLWCGLVALIVWAGRELSEQLESHHVSVWPALRGLGLGQLFTISEAEEEHDENDAENDAQAAALFARFGSLWDTLFTQEYFRCHYGYVNRSQLSLLFYVIMSHDSDDSTVGIPMCVCVCVVTTREHLTL